MRWVKRLIYFFILLFILTNIVVYNHAYNFTHFVEKDIPKPNATHAKDLGSFTDKLSLAFWGIQSPKLKNKISPDSTFQTFTLGNNPRLHAWLIPTKKEVKGVVILFHGYSGNKSSQIPPARVFRKLGYHTFLIDFRGHGDSEGGQTTIGYHEAKDVKLAYDYIKRYYEDLPITLFGTSMGAVAILKAQHDYQLDIKNIIIEAPFAALSDAVNSRFENLGIPQVILPELLLFWGGLLGDMNAFEHDATIYAQKVTVPCLHLYGKNDPKVRMKETKAVFNALAGKRRLKVLKNAAHDNMMIDDPEVWTATVWEFLEE